MTVIITNQPVPF